MTEKTSGQGYDDVLSSVRRLVASEAEAAADAEPGKLLLTPSLRVADPAESGEERTAAADPSRDFPTLEERIAELEAAVGSEPVDWEPDGSEDQTQHAPDAVVLPLNPGGRRAESVRGEPQTNEADIVFAVPGDSVDVTERSDDSVDAGADDKDRTEAVTPSAPPSDTEAPPVATFRHRGEAPGFFEESTQDEDDPALLDEGALRDLIAEIVREELQGGLGERITRNVRKLVRAEIQRAFAARDLD